MMISLMNDGGRRRFELKTFRFSSSCNRFTRFHNDRVYRKAENSADFQWAEAPNVLPIFRPFNQHTVPAKSGCHSTETRAETEPEKRFLCSRI